MSDIFNLVSIAILQLPVLSLICPWSASPDSCRWNQALDFISILRHCEWFTGWRSQKNVARYHALHNTSYRQRQELEKKIHIKEPERDTIVCESEDEADRDEEMSAYVTES